jgi:hypothetical protein
MTMYVNDTALFTSYAVTQASIFGHQALNFSECIEGAALNITGQAQMSIAPGGNEYQIGGNYWAVAPQTIPLNQAAPTGNGLAAACTEMWMSTQFIDWTNSANRKKFHTQDSVGNYVPVNLGATGKITGLNSPFLYCTGGPAAFRVNRANGRLLGMRGGSGLSTFLDHYGTVQEMFPDTRVPG